MEFMSIFTKFTMMVTIGSVFLSLLALLIHIKPPKNPKLLFKTVGVLLFVAAVLSCLIGFGAYSVEMLEVAEALPMAKPEYVDAMRAQGEGYAMVPLKISLGNIIPLIVSVFTFVRGLRS